LVVFLSCAGAAFADRVVLKDGTSIEADDVWDDPQGVWYRQGGVTYLVEHERVKSIEHARAKVDAKRQDETKNAKNSAGARIVAANFDANGASEKSDVNAAVSSVASRAGETVDRVDAQSPQPVTIYLKGGASFEVDEVSETDDGAWYKRGGLSIFIARERIERIEREKPQAADVAQVAARRERRWTTGSGRLDQLIRQNGARQGVDPYLIFLVMEQESHFNTRAVSPTGARGLMQLMPGTAARFGVRNAHDPAQSVAGGTRYLKQLLGKFNNRVDLVLAGYNAGEGSVVRFGYRVPPYRETRSYVRRISSRYGSLAHDAPDAERAKEATAKR
jgi:soluble lytic murein transglycosylase-like protein